MASCQLHLNAGWFRSAPKMSASARQQTARGAARIRSPVVIRTVSADPGEAGSESGGDKHEVVAIGPVVGDSGVFGVSELVIKGSCQLLVGCA